jgi:hypothetical protein
VTGALVSDAGYWRSPWPGEDGGPSRLQAPHGVAGLGIEAGEHLEVTSRDRLGVTMVVLRDPGEVFVLRHSWSARQLEDPVTAWVERIDPVSLEVLERSPELPAGRFWPGGLAAHANGSLYTVFGNWCHRLAPDLSVLARRELPQPRPYNSFVILADGTLATKDFDRDGVHPSLLSLLDPDTLKPRCADVDIGEPAIARLSTDGTALYVVGASTVRRYLWDTAAACLTRDDGWSLQYRTGPGQSYGWDPVIAAGQLWFMDNGEHTYTTSMRHAGVAPGPVHLLRVSLADARDHELVEVSGTPYGTITDPPLVDPARRIVVGYDSGNPELVAWRFGEAGLQPVWRREYATSSHLLLYGDTGELVVNDFHDGLPPIRDPRLRRLAMRSGRLVTSRRLRAAAARRCHDDIVVLDIETGREKARAAVPSLFQGVLFIAAGWGRDLYYCTFSTLARVAVAEAD